MLKSAGVRRVVAFVLCMIMLSGEASGYVYASGEQSGNKGAVSDNAGTGTEDTRVISGETGMEDSDAEVYWDTEDDFDIGEEVTEPEMIEEETEKDWAEEKVVNYSIIELEDTDEYLQTCIKLDFHFGNVEGQSMENIPEDEDAESTGDEAALTVMPGDKLTFEIPEEWFLVEDTEEDVTVPVYAGIQEDYGKKEAELGTDILAEYTIQDQKVELVFTDYAAQEDISALFGRLEILAHYNENALTNQPQEVVWKIQTYEDSTTYDLTLWLPSLQEEQQVVPEENQKEEVGEKEEEVQIREESEDTEEDPDKEAEASADVQEVTDETKGQNVESDSRLQESGTEESAMKKSLNKMTLMTRMPVQSLFGSIRNNGKSLNVEKIWNLAEGGQIPEETAVVLRLFRQSSSGTEVAVEARDANGVLAEFRLDGKADTQEEEVTFTLDSNTVTFCETTASEEENWTGCFTGLPEKNTDGSDCVYSVYEIPIDGWNASYTSVVNNDVQSVSITNTQSAETKSVPISKHWYDDGDINRRQPVTIQAYTYSELEDYIELVSGADSVILTQENNWSASVEIPKEVQQVLLLETRIGETEIVYSPEDLKSIWHELYSSNSILGKESSPRTVTVGNITYNQWYSIEQHDGVSIYVVTNQPVEEEKWSVIAQKTGYESAEGSCQAMTQDLFLIDNNSQAGRFTKEEFLNAFLKNGALTAKYTDEEGEHTISFPVTSIVDAAQLKITEAGETGHYVMTLDEGALPSGLKNEKGETVSIEWSFTATDDIKKLTESYYFIDVGDDNKESLTSQPDTTANGWYYVRTFEYTAAVIVRDGLLASPADLSEKLKGNLKLTWIEKDGGEERSETIDHLVVRTHDASQVVYEWQQLEEDKYVFHMENLPRYRIDGTEYVYTLESISESDASGKIIADLYTDENHPDWLEVSYVNASVSNHGDSTDKVYSGGEIIYTLQGNQTFAANKVWADKANDSAQRPALRFQLWRYSLREESETTGEGFKTAAPVKNNMGKGDILCLNVPEGYTEVDEFRNIDFTESLVEGQTDDVLLLSGEHLPKYDPEGYEYVYFIRETMSGNGADSYIPLYGQGIQNSDGTWTVTDTFPASYGSAVRKDEDTGIYNGGTLTNMLSEQVSTTVKKTWVASSFQHCVEKVEVVFQLQVKKKGDAEEDYVNAQDISGNAITCTMGDFRSELMSAEYSCSVPRYDYDGNEVEYRWVEAAVYYKNDPEKTNLLANGQFQIKDSDGIYYFTSEEITTEDGRTEIENRIADTVNYKVTKQWEDADGNISSIPPQNYQGTITLKLYRQDSSGNIEPVMTDAEAESPSRPVEVTLNGSSSSEPLIFTVEERTVTFSENPAWTGLFEGLPRYDAEGRKYTYVIFEGSSDWTPRYTNKYEIGENGAPDTFVTEIVNSPGDSQEIYVRKRWLDDSDIEHRGEVTLTVYERIETTAEGETEKIYKYEPVKVGETIVTAVLTEEGAWWDKITLPRTVDLSNVIVLETEIKNDRGTEDTSDDDVTEISYTQEELAVIYNKIHGSAVLEERKTDAVQKFNTADYKYNQWYSMEEIADILFYTVTNQRTGVVDVTATKKWEDGDASSRIALKEKFDEKGWSLAFQLNCVEKPECIVYNQINVGNKGPVGITDATDQIQEYASSVSGDVTGMENPDYTISAAVPIQGNEGNPAKSTQKLDMNLEKNSDTGEYELDSSSGNSDTEILYFHNLPKFDESGNVLHYTVDEIVIDESSGTKMTWQEAMDLLAEEGFETNYSSVRSDSGYTVGKRHTEDTQSMTVINGLSGTKNITFYKEWLDNYRFELIERPDIYLDIYQLVHEKSEDGSIVEVLQSYYKNYEWTANPIAGKNNYWEITLTDLPKYDQYGYEIYYYAQEGMRVTGENFHYKSVYYEDDTKRNLSGGVSEPDAENDNDLQDTKEALISGELIGNEAGYDGAETKYDTVTGSDGVAKQVPWLAQLTNEDGSSTYLLKEDGTFVNKLEASVVISGKKLWRNIPAGYKDEDLPAITFYLWQFKKESVTDADGVTTTSDVMYNADGQKVEDRGEPGYEDEKTAENAVASITITNWKECKQDGTYVFQMEYLGENINQFLSDSTINVKPVDASQAMIPLYDERGERYIYQTGEAIQMPDKIGDSDDPATDGDYVYKQPEINGYMITNYYQSSKSQLSLKKIFGNLELDEGETYPEMHFLLERYYPIVQKTEDGKKELVYEKDYSFSMEKVIKSEDITSGKAEVAFENLDVYAPSGRKFKYVIRENLSDYIDGGYKIYAQTGDLEVTAFDTSKEAIADLEQGMEAGGTSDTTGKTDVTFLNWYESGNVILQGGKTWDDTGNSAGVRPDVFKDGNPDSVVLDTKEKQEAAPIQLVVKRYTESKPGVDNAIGSADEPLEVKSGTYQITWTRDSTNPNRWTYEITGLTELKDDGQVTREAVPLEKYAPNGMLWHYIVEEKLAAPYDAFYQIKSGAAEYGVSEETDIYEPLGSKDLVNEMKESLTAKKTWDLTSIAGHANANSIPYVMQVEFTLQARVEKVYDADTKEWKSVDGKWRKADDLLKLYLNEGADSDYAAIIAAMGENNIVQTKTGEVDDSTVWDSVYEFQNLAGAIQTEKTAVSDGSEIAGGTFVQLKYRAVESRIEYGSYNIVDGESTFTPVLTQYVSVKTPPEGSPDEIEYVSSYDEEIPSAGYLFTPTAAADGVKNTLETVNFNVYKWWKGDHNDAYNLRQANGSNESGWTLRFVVERRIKSVEDSNTNQWEYLKEYNKSDGSERYVVISMDVNSDSTSKAMRRLENLPKYGIETINGQVQVVEYEYRARELPTDKELGYSWGQYQGSFTREMLDQALKYSERFNDAYNVWYGKAASEESLQNLSSVIPDTNDTYKANDREEALTGKYNGTKEYYTLVTDELKIKDTIDVAAEKNWPGNCDFDSVKAGMKVELELQYLSTDTDDEGEYIWKPFKQNGNSLTNVILNGTTDDENVTGYEYEPWKAKWLDVPRLVPDSVKEEVTLEDGSKELQTRYRVVEKSGSDYFQSDNTTDGTTNTGGGIESNPYVFHNVPTSLEISKKADFFSNGEVMADIDVTKQFTYTITSSNSKTEEQLFYAVKTGKDGTTKTYWYVKLVNGKATQMRPEVGGDYQPIAITADEKLVIYGLPYTFNGSDRITYQVTETIEDGFEAQYTLDHDPTSTEGHTTSGITFEDVNDSSHAVEFTNIIHGTIYIDKVDEKGQPIGGAKFQIEYQSNLDADGNPIWKILNAENNDIDNICKDESLIRNEGIITTKADGTGMFNGLKLGMTYRITELSVPDGHNKLMEPFVVELPYKTSGSPDVSSSLKPIGSTGEGINLQYVYAAVRYQIGNNSSLKMPSTGFKKLFWPGIAGLALIGLGLTYWNVSGRKKKKAI